MDGHEYDLTFALRFDGIEVTSRKPLTAGLVASVKAIVNTMLGVSDAGIARSDLKEGETVLVFVRNSHPTSVVDLGDSLA